MKKNVTRHKKNIDPFTLKTQRPLSPLNSLSFPQLPHLFAMHSLFKIFYILVSTTACWITFTPPNPPPAKDEEAESTVLEVLIRQHSSRFIIKVSY